MATKKDSTKKNSKKKSITEEDIRKKAQEIYDKRIRDGIRGDAESDWDLAKEQLGLK